MIYICVPAHDEARTVGVVLWKVRQVMAEASRDYQILVADDASTDRTAEVLEPYTRVLPLTVMRSEDRRGYAASLEMLLREAVHRSEYPRRDVVVVLQADFTEEPEHIVTLLKRIESGADIVASNPRRSSRPPFRERANAAVCRFLLGRSSWPEGVEDPLVSFQAYRVATLRRAFEEVKGGRLLRWEGAVANAGLLRQAAPHARRVDCVDWTPRPERRQRASRADAGQRLRSVWAFSRNREQPDLLPVASLAPSAIRTARSQDHEPTVESLRAAGVTRYGESEAPARRRRRGSSPRSKGEAPAGAEKSSGRSREATNGDRSGRSRRRRNGAGGGGVKEGRAPDGVEDTGRARRRREPNEPAKTGVEEEVAGAQTPPRKRRSRGGRKRTRAERPDTVSPLQNEEASEPPARPAPDAQANGEGAAGGEGSEGRKPRRRRGRRGGRRRSGQRPGSNGGGDAAGGTGSPPTEEGGEPSAD